MDFGKLSNGARLALVGGGVVVVALFLPWYGVFGSDLNAFDSGFLAWGGSLVAVVGALFLLYKELKESQASKSSASHAIAEMAALALGGLGLALILFFTLTDPGRNVIGPFLAILGSAGVVVGAAGALRAATLEPVQMRATPSRPPAASSNPAEPERTGLDRRLFEQAEPLQIDRDGAMEYWRELQTGLMDASRGLDKMMTTIAVGALGVSVVFLRDLASDPQRPWVLATSWALLTIALMGTLLAFLCSIAAHEKIATELSSGTPLELIDDNPSSAKVTRWATRISATILVVGVGFLLWFAGVNLLITPE